MCRLPLTHSQWRFWPAGGGNPPEFSPLWDLTRGATVVDGVRFEEIAAAVDLLVSRHESMRTTFAVAADGESVQIVHRPRAVPTGYRETTGEIDHLAAIIDAVAAEPIDITRDWPLGV